MISSRAKDLNRILKISLISFEMTARQRLSNLIIAFVQKMIIIPLSPSKGDLYLVQAPSAIAIELIPAFGLSAYASFSGAERSEVLRRRSKGKAPSAMPEGEPSRA
ncbi:hypothetical protein A3841_16485 [Pontibacter flavimaris]|uniref:Uncharacterized protein n=1 Tax=Pontibacter flavimaris TaxID=1797110 RepID=A0A1Q5PCU7_9BACT|nr:hypothetical protein A3841_16485 [Pontibacter flavimaris]